MGEVGTVMSYAAMPLLQTIEGDDRVKLVVLCGDANGDVTSKQNYPQDQWDAYCEWVQSNFEHRRMRFLISSQFWTPSDEQHKQLLTTSGMKKEDRKTYLSAVVGNDEKVSRTMKAIYAAAALACRIKDGIPIKFFPDGDLRSALEYLRIEDGHFNDLEELCEELQIAMDKRNDRPVRKGAR